MENKDMDAPEQEPNIVADAPPVASSKKKKVILVGCGFCVLLFLVYAGIGLPMLAKLKPNVQESSEVAKAEDAARVQRLQGKTLKLKGLVESLETKGGKLYSQADLDEARALAEQLEYADMIQRLDAFELAVEVFKNRSAQDKQQAYEEECRRLAIEIDKLSLKGALITNDKLNELKGDLESLYNPCDELLPESLPNLIDQLREQMKTNMAFAQSKDEFSVSSGNATQYASALRSLHKFLQENPLDAEMKNDIEFVLLESNFWEGVLAWGQFYSVQFQPKLIIKSPIKIAAERAQDAIEKGTSLVQMYPEFETKSEYEDRIEVLLSIAERPQANIVQLRAELLKIIGSTEAVIVANYDSRKTTFNLPVLLPWETFSNKKVGSKIVFKAYLDNRDHQGDFGVREADFIYYGPAPHPIIEKELFNVIDALNGSTLTWEEAIMDALDVLFETEKFAFPNQVKNFIGNKNLIQLHPIQRLIVARSLLSFGTHTSVILNEKFGAALNALEVAVAESGINDYDIDFVGPTTAQLRLTNNNADKALAALEVTLDKTRPVVLRQLDDFSKTPEASVIWVGWIDVRDGGYTVRFSDGKPKSGAMFTVMSNGLDTSEARIIELGSANGGVLQIPQNAVGSNFKHRFGRPVFTYSETTTKE